MKNAIAVACALLLPLNLVPPNAFAVAGKPVDDSVVTHNKVTYMKVDVQGQKGPYYCEIKECKDPATLQKLGSVPLYFDFDKDGDPTLSEYSVKFDPTTKTQKVIKTQANSYSATVAVPDDKGKAAVQVFVAGTSGKKETYYTTKAGTTADKPTLFKEDGTTPSGYLLKAHPDHAGHYLAVRENPVREAPAPVAKTPPAVVEKPGLRTSSLVGADSDAKLDALCAERGEPGVAGSKNDPALKQLEAAKEGDMGMSSDGQSVSPAANSALDEKCAQRKKDKALASGGIDEGKAKVGSAAPPPDLKAAAAVQETKAAVTPAANTGLMENWGSYAGGIAGGAVLAVIAVAIMGGPVGLAAGAGAAVGLVGMALYNNRNEIGQAVSTGVIAVMNFFKGG